MTLERDRKWNKLNPVRVRPEGYETAREYRARRIKELREAKQRNHEWGFSVLQALALALNEAGDPGARPVELVRPSIARRAGYRVVAVSAGWPVTVRDARPGHPPQRITLLADGRWGQGGWDRDERCLRVLRAEVRPVGETWRPQEFDEALVSSVEALELAHGFRIRFPDG